MYTRNTFTDQITRDSNGMVVAPSSLETQEQIDAFNEYIQWASRPGNFPTPYTPEIITPKVITSYEFRDRFTQSELIAINRLAFIGDGDDYAILLLQKVNTATDGIDLTSQSVIDGLSYLAFKGCITPERIPGLLA